MNRKRAIRTIVTRLNYAADSLGLYRADLARILKLMCSDVSIPGELEALITVNVQYQKRAEQFIYFFSLAEDTFADNMPAMINWFRKEHNVLETSPYLAIVDQGRLADVIELIKQHHSVGKDV